MLQEERSISRLPQRTKAMFQFHIAITCFHWMVAPQVNLSRGVLGANDNPKKLRPLAVSPQPSTCKTFAPAFGYHVMAKGCRVVCDVKAIASRSARHESAGNPIYTTQAQPKSPIHRAILGMTRIYTRQPTINEPIASK